MSTPIEFGTFSYVPISDVWQHEARAFTPWLSNNLDRLAEPLGIDLELIGTEVDVGGFSADILARDRWDGRNVLIENQLSPSDHGHLGQILTYLAGLDAKVVVWIAPNFRQPHLSAIRWLNEHTEESVAFFAVQLRPLRIGDSPIVPLLEVIEGPNEWDRHIQSRARELGVTSEIGAFRQAFWRHYLAKFLSEGDSATPYAGQARRRRMLDLGLIVTQFIAYRGVGIFVRVEWNGGEHSEARDRLMVHSGQLAAQLGSSRDNAAAGQFFLKELKLDMRERANWDRASDWLKSEADRYEAVLRQVLLRA